MLLRMGLGLRIKGLHMKARECIKCDFCLASLTFVLAFAAYNQGMALGINMQTASGEMKRLEDDVNKWLATAVAHDAHVALLCCAKLIICRLFEQAIILPATRKGPRMVTANGATQASARSHAEWPAAAC